MLLWLLLFSKQVIRTARVRRKEQKRQRAKKKKGEMGEKEQKTRRHECPEEKKKSWEKHVRKKWALFSDMILRCAPSMNWKSTHPADHCFECYLLHSSSKKKKSCALQVSVHHYFFWISLFVCLFVCFWGEGFHNPRSTTLAGRSVLRAGGPIIIEALIQGKKGISSSS